MPGDLILHIGAPKCGSSSLQSALSRRPDFKARDGTAYKYVCLRPKGPLLQGRALRRRALGSRYMYASSPNVNTSELATSVLSRNAHEVATLRADGQNVILSSEGWTQRADTFEATDFIRKAGGNAHVVIYLRPGIDWLNSAWWQWNVWGGRGLHRAIKANTQAVGWPKKLRAWAKVPGVDRLTVRLASSDTVAGFYDLLNADVPPIKNANSGVPPAFLHFLLRNREYRPSAHDSSIEFIVGRNITSQRFPAPWALPQQVVRDTIEKISWVPKSLQPFLEPHERALVEADQRWWSPEAYSDRVLDRPEEFLTAESLSGLLQTLTSNCEPRQIRGLTDAFAEIDAASSAQVVSVADKHISTYLDAMKNRDDRKRGWLAVLGRSI